MYEDVPGLVPAPVRRRSKAWIYYAVLTFLTLFAIVGTHGASLLATLLFGLYSTYLYRGGRFVIWFW